MDTEAPPAPTVDPALFSRVQAALESSGPVAAIDRLCDELKAAGDVQNLFYARLMRKRVELGVAPFPSGPATDLPAETHEAYEDAIRQAGREVGRMCLDRGDIPKAWVFFRMLGEPEPVRAAIAAYDPGPDEDVYPVIEVAWQQAVLPTKGFDLILDRNGVCSAITMVHSADLSGSPTVKEHCVKRLVRALHEQLTERLRNDLEQRAVAVPPGATIPQMIAGRDELFADDLYHIDVSHLSSVVQLALQLDGGPELGLARELCVYGEKLSPNLRGDNDPPFDDTYTDYRIYLDILIGENVEAGLAHFRTKLAAAAEEGMTYPAEVVVNLLLRIGRRSEALDVAKIYLSDVGDRPLSCPGVIELARQAGDFPTLAEIARRNADPVNFLAGLIAGRKP